MLTNFAKHFILDVGQGFEYASGTDPGKQMNISVFKKFGSPGTPAPGELQLIFRKAVILPQLFFCHDC